MTTQSQPDGESEEITFADIRALQAQNARAISELSAIQLQTTQNIERLFAAFEGLRSEQALTSQDVSTLKGWGLENLCERHPELFADALDLRSAELVPTTEIIDIANAAYERGIITRDQRASVTSADVYFYGRRESDDTPACLLVQVSFMVNLRDVQRAFDQAGILNEIIQQYQPRYLNGRVIPVVSGTRIRDDAQNLADDLGVTYVPIQNGNQLTNPPE